MDTFILLVRYVLQIRFIFRSKYFWLVFILVPVHLIPTILICLEYGVDPVMIKLIYTYQYFVVAGIYLSIHTKDTE